MTKLSWIGVVCLVSLYYGRVFLSGKKMAAALLAAIKRAGEQRDSGEAKLSYQVSKS
jgi:hypothetical protein